MINSLYIQIDDKQSELVDVKFGVPHASILGPVFKLYVSDLQDQIILVSFATARCRTSTIAKPQ